MSLGSFLKDMLLGRPVYKTPAQPAQQTPQPASPAPAPAQPAGPKVVPQAYIESVDCTETGTAMRCVASIQNYSSEPLDMDRVEILGTSFDLGTVLKAGEERRFNLYDGPRVTSTTNSLCRLYFKRPADTDAFCANHTVEFERQADNTYSIRHIRFTYIQDV